MNKVLVLMFLSLFFVFNLHSQDNKEFRVTGIINESATLTPLEFSTITLLNNKTKEIFGGITDKNGNFNVKATSGIYTLKIEYISFKDKVFTNFNLDKNISLGTVLLFVNTESLEQIDISEKSKLTTFKLGKTVYNVENDLASKGGTATDVLENAPSVTVLDGIATIRGVKATVMINGRVSSLTKPKALQNLQASSIKKIEVITSPSARHRGTSTGGIINIILKKGMDNGWNGSVTASGGIKNVYGGAATLNYRKNSFSFYSNSSYFKRERIGNTIIENEYFSNGITDNYLKENRLNNRNVNVLNTILGVDYYLNDYAYINIEGNYANLDGKIKNTNKYDFYDSNNLLTTSSDQILSTDHSNDLYDLSATYNQYFKREGESLFFNFSFSKDSEFNDSELFYNNSFPISEPLPNQDESIYESLNIKNTSWKAYYVFPTSVTSNLEFGTEGSLGDLESIFINKIKNNDEFILDPTTSNTLSYKENWYGFYAEFISEKEKFSYLLGVRSETTYLDFELQTNNQQNSQNYTDILPSVQLEYSIKENKILALTYQRALQRANYPNLNPFEQRISETTSFVGNIELLPFYANNFELSILNTNKESKFILKPSLYFKNYDNIWQYITVETGDIINGVPKLITTPINLGRFNFTGLEILSNYNPTDRIELSATLDTRYASTKGIYEYTDSNNKIVILDYENNGFSGFAELNSSIKLSESFNFQSLLKYEYAAEGAYSKKYGYGYINVSLNKEMFNGAGSLTLAATDILNTQKTKRLRWTADVESLSNSQWKEPSLLLTFTYRFNQSKKDIVIDIDKKDIEEKY